MHLQGTPLRLVILDLPVALAHLNAAIFEKGAVDDTPCRFYFLDLFHWESEHGSG